MQKCFSLLLSRISGKVYVRVIILVILNESDCHKP